MRRAIGMFVVLCAFWLLLSGLFQPLLLAFGVLSAIGVVLLVRRMDAVDQASYWTPLRWSAVPAYLLWLAREVLLANIDVMRRVLAPNLHISPTAVEVPVAPVTDVGTTLFANCVTLTPGTLSVSVDGDRLLVHALTAEGAQALTDGDMGERIAALEVGAAQRQAGA